MLESTSVMDHINTYNVLLSQFSAMEHTIEEMKHVKLFLQSLLDSYDQLIINMINNTSNLVFDTIIVVVLEEENKHNLL